MIYRILIDTVRINKFLFLLLFIRVANRVQPINWRPTRDLLCPCFACYLLIQLLSSCSFTQLRPLPDTARSPLSSRFPVLCLPAFHIRREVLCLPAFLSSVFQLSQLPVTARRLTERRLAEKTCREDLQRRLAELQSCPRRTVLAELSLQNCPCRTFLAELSLQS